MGIKRTCTKCDSTQIYHRTKTNSYRCAKCGTITYLNKKNSKE